MSVLISSSYKATLQSLKDSDLVMSATQTLGQKTATVGRMLGHKPEDADIRSAWKMLLGLGQLFHRVFEENNVSIDHDEQEENNNLAF